MDILFAKGIPARKFASTRIDEFDEVETDRLAEIYAGGHGPRRPSIQNAMAHHGMAPETAAQNRASFEIEEGQQRHPSISEGVTNYLEKH